MNSFAEPQEILNFLSENYRRRPVRAAPDVCQITGRLTWVTPKYFDTARMRRGPGRDFTDQAEAGALREVVVNQKITRRIYDSEQNAAGKRFCFAQRKSSDELMEIIGIAWDGRCKMLYENPQT